MSKIEEIAERLAKEIKEKTGVRKVVVDEHGNVDVYGKSEFEISDTEGNTQKVELPSRLPARIGKTAFRKLDKNVSDGGFSVDNPDTLLDAKDYLINQMFDKAGLSKSVDDIDMETYNEVGNYYWNKVVEAEKKRQN